MMTAGGTAVSVEAREGEVVGSGKAEGAVGGFGIVGSGIGAAAGAVGVALQDGRTIRARQARIGMNAGRCIVSSR